MKRIRRVFLLLALFTVLTCTACAEDLRWDFSIDYEPDDWKLTNCTGSVKDGYYNLSATPNGAGNYDPFISHATDFAAEDYRYIVLCMKWENARLLATETSIYFQTDTANLSEATRVTNPTYEGKTTGGKYIVQVFDMSVNANWKGQVTRVRIDTIGSGGDFSVDYICITDTLPDRYDIITASSGASSGGGGSKTYFSETRTYTDGMFTDVSKDEWYYDGIATAYALGFMSGMGDGIFSPEGNMTVAEAVTIASRMHNIYHRNQADFAVPQGDAWYSPYRMYAEENGFLDLAVDNPDANIKRSEMAVLFDGVLPDSYLPGVNHIGYIPDVANDAPYREAVLALYNTGILMGSDAYGSFYPESDITRAEAAAIINRIALAERRVSGSLQPPEKEIPTFTPDAAGHFLIDNATLIYGTALQDGFDFNFAGGKTNYTGASSNVLDDMRENAGSYIRREIQPQNGGFLHLTFSYKLGYDPNGAYFRMADSNDRDLFRLYTENKKYYIVTDGSSVPLGIRAVLNESVWIDVLLDLDGKTYTLYFDGEYGGEYPFAADAKDASVFEAGTTVEGTPMINVASLYLTKDYYMLDDFHNGALDAFTYTAEGKAEYTVNGELQVTAGAGSAFRAASAFAEAQGVLCYELLFYTDKTADGLTFALRSDGSDVFSLTAENGTFVTGSGTAFDKQIAANLWNLLRIEADTASNSAVVKLNGKVLGEAPFDRAANSINGVSIVCHPSSDLLFKVDEAYVTALFDYSDYCPEPQTVESDYILGINVCNLWREGYHRGWGPISPYEEVEPVLGFYDEGLPEVADWEIKFWAEHGIDYQMLCWYGNGQTNAVKMGRGNVSALHEGYFNAKYSDLVKFAIMWENSSNATTLEKFKENVVPYWVEYYLTDPRYMTVDNKPIIAVWSVGTMVSKMGEDGAKQAVEYLRQTCVELGYDGCIFLCCDGHSTRPDQFKTLASIGCDGTYAYHWNAGGAKYYNQVSRMNNYLAYNANPEVPAEEKIPLVPTVSVGFNSIGWKGVRTGLIDDAGYQKVADFIKSDVLPTLEGTPMENMVMISTWNEYGEGTYMMPTKGLGFAYLDDVRRAFTDAAAEHEDAVPTEAQKARLGYLYPQDRHLLSPLYEEDISEYPQTVVHQIKLTEETLSGYELYSQQNKSFNEQGNYTADSTGNSILFNKEPIELNIDNCSYIRVTMRGVKDSDEDNLNGYFFFATDSYPSIEEASRTGFTYPNGGELATYYINMAANTRWHGVLKTLRLDPIGGAGSFELESIEILQDDAKIPVRVNGVQLKTYGVPDTENGHLLVPAVPEYGFFTALAASYDWDAQTKTLSVYANGHSVTFTVGSDKALVDGTEKSLYTTLSLFDNVPLVPLDLLAEFLGYAYTRNDTVIDITTPFQ